jgi:ABC-2 type transport system ATP-binding protein
MTTHILDVAERMADRIGIIANDRLVSEGTLEELRSAADEAGSGLAAATLEDIFLGLVGDGEVAA